MFNLTSNQEVMYNDLMSILDEICLPGDDDEQAILLSPQSLKRPEYLPVSLKTGVKLDFELLMCY